MLDRRHRRSAWTEGNQARVLIDGSDYFACLYLALLAAGPDDSVFVCGVEGDADELLSGLRQRVKAKEITEPEGLLMALQQEMTSRQALLEHFDRHVAAGRAALASASDETLLAPWTLLGGGKAHFTMPRVAVVRSFVMNHNVHHRAQLGVYLRLLDVAVPSLYGPSADER